MDDQFRYGRLVDGSMDDHMRDGSMDDRFLGGRLLGDSLVGFMLGGYSATEIVLDLAASLKQQEVKVDGEKLHILTDKVLRL